LQKADRDGSGTLSAREIKRMMREMGQELDDEDVDEMIRQADIDGDGEISWEEFKAMMC
jgi:calmodulin